MDTQKLSSLLKPWLAHETWHTGHQLDDQRFHKALKASFDELGVRISSEKFRDAITECLRELRRRDIKAFSEDVEGFAQRAEDIASYLIDIEA